MAYKHRLWGKRFTRLVVLKRIEPGTKWLCKCDCGEEREIDGRSLVQGITKSCGCYHTDAVTKHGHTTHSSASKEYRAWNDMKQRCYNSGHVQFADYGGRGITVCERWLHSFDNFYADMGAAPPGLTLDRINNDGNYEPDNCRWATRLQQTRNRRRSRTCL